MNLKELHQSVASLLAQVNLQGQFEIQPLSGGANNQVFRIDVNGSQLCLKTYFHHQDDQRDRLGAEFSFLHFAWNQGVRALPQPLVCDPHQRLALYEFIPGRKLQPGEVTQEMVQQALDFYRDLNQHKDKPEARSLPKASEFCCSLADHIHRVDCRVTRLFTMEDSSLIDREAIKFVRDDLSKMWGQVKTLVHRQADKLMWNPNEEISQSDWYLSPSDFGFHNALLGVDGKLRFIDFEYAGWDDPDRMVCDFFCQPAVPVPLDYYALVSETVAAGLGEPERHRKRMELLLPVYQVKWCCILLNDFLPPGSARRRFSNGTTHPDERKAHQLQKARNALKCLSLVIGILFGI